MKIVHSLLAAVLAAAWTASAFAAETLFVDAPTVRKVQKTLTDRGFRTGGIDGRMGPQTQAALVNFQKAGKLKPTGQLNRETLVALGLQNPDGTPTAGEQRHGRETIRKVQETLNARGFKAGPPNGTLGESTSSALRAFQKSENIAVTGRLNPRTLAALGIDPGSASAGSTRGAQPSSATIRELQRRLANRGFNPGAPDGIMGPATRAALVQFQRAGNLPVTGRADRDTLNALGIGAGLAARR